MVQDDKLRKIQINPKQIFSLIISDLQNGFVLTRGVLLFEKNLTRIIISRFRSKDTFEMLLKI